MNPQVLFSAAMLVGLIQSADGAAIPRRATLTGGGGNGKCTIEVVVDGSAEVEVSGDSGWLTTLSGETSIWRRFQCNGPIPRNPDDFRFLGVDGRGSVRLVRDPRGNHGRAVVRIDDPKGGREGYTFDLVWRGGGNGGGWQPLPPPQPPPTGGGAFPGGFPMARAIQNCQESVTNRLNRDGFSSVAFDRMSPNDNPGRNDWITGMASARRGYGTTWFAFSCSVDFNSGRVRSVEVRRR